MITPFTTSDYQTIDLIPGQQARFYRTNGRYLELVQGASDSIFVAVGDGVSGGAKKIKLEPGGSVELTSGDKQFEGFFVWTPADLTDAKIIVANTGLRVRASTTIGDVGTVDTVGEVGKAARLWARGGGAGCCMDAVSMGWLPAGIGAAQDRRFNSQVYFGVVLTLSAPPIGDQAAPNTGVRPGDIVQVDRVLAWCGPGSLYGVRGVNNWYMPITGAFFLSLRQGVPSRATYRNWLSGATVGADAAANYKRALAILPTEQPSPVAAPFHITLDQNGNPAANTEWPFSEGSLPNWIHVNEANPQTVWKLENYPWVVPGDYDDPVLGQLGDGPVRLLALLPVPQTDLDANPRVGAFPRFGIEVRTRLLRKGEDF